MSQAGDTIQIHSPPSGSSALELCSQYPPIEHTIQHDLTIQGVGSKPAVFCSKDDQLLFHIIHGTVTITNLQFNQGRILTHNSTVHIHKCVFKNDAGIFAMNLYSLRKRSENDKYSIILPTLLAILYNPTKYHYSCHYTTLNITDTQWEMDLDSTHIFIDALLDEGIQVMCFSSIVSISRSYIANRRVHIHAVETLHVHIEDTTFKETANGRFNLGGLVIEIFPYLRDPSITVENCLFDSIHYEDIFAEISFTVQEKAAAIQIMMTMKDVGADEEVQEKYMAPQKAKAKDYLNESRQDLFSEDGETLLNKFEKLNLQELRYAVNILNCTFRNNSRALSLVFDEEYRLSLMIYKSVFLNNSHLMTGGSVFIEGASYVHIIDSLFINNTAGYSGWFESSFPHPMKIKKFSNFTIDRFEITGQRVSFWYTGPDEKHSSGFESDVGYVEFKGEGGAIYVASGYCELVNTKFSGNEAYGYGGSVSSAAPAHISIKDSYLETAVNPHIHSFNGELIDSRGSLILDNVLFIARTSGMRGSNAGLVSHNTDATHDTAYVTNFTVLCPNNSILNIFNASGSVFSDDDEKGAYLGYNKLQYTCVPCAYGNYSLLNGYIHLPHIENMSVEVDDEVILNPELVARAINYTDVTCYKCPYGGVCNGTVIPLVAKPNYWGSRR